MSIRDLLEEGRLEVGEELEMARRSASTLRATVRADGQLEVGDGRIASTPSKAAQLAAGEVRPIDGWKRWRVVRLDQRTLAEVRDGASS